VIKGRMKNANGKRIAFSQNAVVLDQEIKPLAV
jgi:hypothetical protein